MRIDFWVERTGWSRSLNTGSSRWGSPEKVTKLKHCNLTNFSMIWNWYLTFFDIFSRKWQFVDDSYLHIFDEYLTNSYNFFHKGEQESEIWMSNFDSICVANKQVYIKILYCKKLFICNKKRVKSAQVDIHISDFCSLFYDAFFKDVFGNLSD